jgi:hypothetical protein
LQFINGVTGSARDFCKHEQMPSLIQLDFGFLNAAGKRT